MAIKPVRRIDPQSTQKLLLARRSELLSRLNSEPIAVTRTDQIADMDDQATFMHDEFVSLRLRSNDYGQFRQVTDALARLENGTYGVCLGCDKPISPRRLLALPWAEYCTPCEDLSESREGTAAGAAKQMSQASTLPHLRQRRSL